MSKKDIIEKELDKSLAKGWKMSKKTREGYTLYGFLSSAYIPSQWKKIVVYNRKELQKGIKNGYSLSQDAGLISLNILLKI